MKIEEVPKNIELINSTEIVLFFLLLVAFQHLWTIYYWYVILFIGTNDVKRK